ncbi:peptidase S10 serine carboxypeptidase [Coniophora puteana RWD-64-598 SS2]|uniref:Carboxypeptidase n=1 Tax=Coniophora puteana (strain RWD-64-598) TaxID=741705 RepID=A0A5M3N7I9_CONPW|nr:peptidase S10 serine carboxypeptidase [Coniophora puteana RWD-64-598 SS2]EIW87420.1 peptidase S10 serine carboxypeptidase [Coniophora puteana RWD-64-598 SS2]
MVPVLADNIANHPAFEGYQLRIKEPTFCDPSVQQYSGYLDITEGKHLFFWFFESRSNPSEDPVVLWLNGGPGCSSTSGLLFELGPCSISDEGNSTALNPYSWNSQANIIFLDQPIDVGFSYSTDGSTVISTPDAAKDVYAFLAIFMSTFPKYAKLPFHLAAESYGGRYAPHMASEIIHRNRDRAPGVPEVNLASVMIGNGLVDPRIQMPSVVEYACSGPYAIYDDPYGAECQALRLAAPTCQGLIEQCYKHDSRLTCIPASEVCWNGVFGPVFSHGHNMYDARKKCEPEENGDLCYKGLQYVEKWMNSPAVQAELGVDPAAPAEYKTCNVAVTLKFRFLVGDGMKNGAALLPELIEHGVRLLIYAGNADLMCNYQGETKFVEALPNLYQNEFQAAPFKSWTIDGNRVGLVRSAGVSPESAGNLTLAIVYEAGHMVPHDQPEVALDMMLRWINDEPIA